MGLHTWCYKDKALHDEQIALYEKLYKHEAGEEILSDEELLKIETRSSEIYDLNETDYHDCFRTVKRNKDGTYTDDVIYSKEECYQWLKDNNAVVSDLDEDYLNKFWNEFPNGVIDFG